jgi:hypothetical protein
MGGSLWEGEADGKSWQKEACRERAAKWIAKSRSEKIRLQINKEKNIFCECQAEIKEGI